MAVMATNKNANGNCSIPSSERKRALTVGLMISNTAMTKKMYASIQSETLNSPSRTSNIFFMSRSTIKKWKSLRFQDLKYRLF